MLSMYRKLLAGFVFVILCSTALFAQKDIVSSIEANEFGKGKVRIFMDATIANLLKSTKVDLIEKGDKKMIKTTGYRVQIFAGNNTREAKLHAESIAQEILEYFPNLTVYTPFLSPRWICRVGDFTSIEEADATLRNIRKLKKFKEVAIVRDQILIPIEE